MTSTFTHESHLEAKMYVMEVCTVEHLQQKAFIERSKIMS
jgi:hypothetical protein